MADHDDQVLYTGVLVVRAWGWDRFADAVKESAKDIVKKKIPIIPGVLFEFDPGGDGGPGTREIQRKFDFVMDGRQLPGEPPYEG